MNKNQRQAAPERMGVANRVADKLVTLMIAKAFEVMLGEPENRTPPKKAYRTIGHIAASH